MNHIAQHARQTSTADLLLKKYTVKCYEHYVQISIAVSPLCIDDIGHSAIVSGKIMPFKPVPLWNDKFSRTAAAVLNFPATVNVLLDMMRNGRIDNLPGGAKISRRSLSNEKTDYFDLEEDVEKGTKLLQHKIIVTRI